jgi:flagellar motor component MotA
MKFKVMRILGFLMGVAWIAFGVFIMARREIEGTARVFAAIAIIGAGLYFISYAFTGRSTLRKWKSD